MLCYTHGTRFYKHFKSYAFLRAFCLCQCKCSVNCVLLIHERAFLWIPCTIRASQIERQKTGMKKKYTNDLIDLTKRQTALISRCFWEAEKKQQQQQVNKLIKKTKRKHIQSKVRTVKCKRNHNVIEICWSPVMTFQHQPSDQIKNAY